MLDDCTLASLYVNILLFSMASHLRSLLQFNTMPSDRHPSGYIVSNADDLLELFDADYGVLVIGEGAKILGPNEHGQEILIVAEYLRLKRFTYVDLSLTCPSPHSNTDRRRFHSRMIQVSQAVTADFP